MSRLEARGATSCQYALFLLRWLGRPPEDFLSGPAGDVGETRLPQAVPNVFERRPHGLSEASMAKLYPTRDTGAAPVDSTVAIT